MYMSAAWNVRNVAGAVAGASPVTPRHRRTIICHETSHAAGTIVPEATIVYPSNSS